MRRATSTCLNGSSGVATPSSRFAHDKAISETKGETMTTQAPDIDPLFDPAIMQNPYEYYRHLRENDPVHEIASSGGAYLVTRAETIFDVVRRTEEFSSMSGEFLHKGEWATPALRGLTGAGYAAAAEDSGGGGLA